MASKIGFQSCSSPPAAATNTGQASLCADSWTQLALLPSAVKYSPGEKAITPSIRSGCSAAMLSASEAEKELPQASSLPCAWLARAHWSESRMSGSVSRYVGLRPPSAALRAVLFLTSRQVPPEHRSTARQL
jgi:hypothetical protein